MNYEQELEQASYQEAMKLINDNNFMLPTTTIGEMIQCFKGLYKAGAQWQKQHDSIPISEDLEDEVIKKVLYFSENFQEAPWAIDSTGVAQPIWFAKFGAQWQKQKMEKNRIEHCDDITEEQYNLETGFVDEHLKKYNRIPTILDAIEYGMKLQKEQMMKDAVDAVIGSAGFLSPLYIENYDKVKHYEFGDKVKLIIIKED